MTNKCNIKYKIKNSKNKLKMQPFGRLKESLLKVLVIFHNQFSISGQSYSILIGSKYFIKQFDN